MIHRYNVKYTEYGDPLSDNVGFLIKKLRKINKISGKTLANHVGISQQQVSRYELGESEITLKKLQIICDFFNISVFDFMNALYFLIYDKNETSDISLDYFIDNLYRTNPSKTHR